MRHKKDNTRWRRLGNWQLLWVIILMVIVAGVGMVNSQQLLLNNARTLGSNLVASFSNDEDSQLSEYDRILAMAMYYMEDLGQDSADIQVFQTWLADFFEKSTTLLHAESLDLYAVLNGQFISAGGDEHLNYDYQSESWYQQALAADGKVIYTDAYPSSRHNGRSPPPSPPPAATMPSPLTFLWSISAPTTRYRTCQRGALTTFWTPRGAFCTTTSPSRPRRKSSRSIPRSCSTG